MNQCAFCNLHPPIAHSHVVPAFIVRFIKDNSPSGFLLNSWTRKPHFDGYKGPYLCATCDNVTFSKWENQFKKLAFDPLQAGKGGAWDDPDAIRFLLSVAFRYGIHFTQTSRTQANSANNLRFTDLTKRALSNLSLINSQIYIYPYVYRPIDQTCELLAGVNQFMRLAFFCRAFRASPDYPTHFY
jgi:hypothetical protein